MKTKLTFNIISALAGILFLAQGCAEMAPDGVYKGDALLYRADSIIPMSYTLLHTYVQWEYTNREMLKGTPQIKASADYVRLNAKNWITSAMVMREAYALVKSDENANKLQASLAILSSALNEATKYMTAHAVTNPK